VLGTLEEVDRPRLPAVVPNVRRAHRAASTSGANANCKARHLEEFAVMADVYTRAVLRIDNPRVGLMSMGEEETKGNELTKEVHEVLKGSRLNFIGNVEGQDLFNGHGGSSS
jgi:glycerol-3-phosphate acyltransferase PlsX